MIFAYQGLARNQYNDLQIFHAWSVLHWHLCYVENWNNRSNCIGLCNNNNLSFFFFFSFYSFFSFFMEWPPFLKDHLDQDRPYGFECANLFPPHTYYLNQGIEAWNYVYLLFSKLRVCHGVVPSWCSWL